MKKTNIIKTIVVALTFVCMVIITTQVRADTIPPMDPLFDYQYYAETYPDLMDAFGYNQGLLWKHYVEFGERERRKCYDGDTGGTIVVNQNIATQAQGDFANDECVQIMLDQINAYRAENGVAALELRQNCMDMANVRVWELTSKISHTRPNGKRFYTAYKDCGYSIPSNCAENLSVHHKDWDFNAEGDNNTYVAYFMNNFKNSKSHNETMLKSKWKYVGISFITNYDGTCYVVQEFSR